LKICLSSTSNNLEAPLDLRFGRCPYLIIIDTESMQFEAIPNLAAGTKEGAGIHAAQAIANKGVKVLITGNVGPNAFRALSAANIEIITDASGTISAVVEKFKQGELKKTGAPTVGGHFGSETEQGRQA
jgi:predicted Fe-Mo cluster-binding NifX family protein